MAAYRSKPARVGHAAFRASLLFLLLSALLLGCRHGDPPSTITFTQVAIGHLNALATKLGESNSAVVRTALRRMHAEEFPNILNTQTPPIQTPNSQTRR